MLANSHREFNPKGFNKRQLEVHKYSKLKTIILSSSNDELKRNFFNSYDKIGRMKLWSMKIKNEFYSNLIKNNDELREISEFKEMYQIKRNYDYDNRSNIFNGACKTFDRPYFMMTKSGKRIRYENYEKYEIARKHFKSA